MSCWGSWEFQFLFTRTKIQNQNGGDMHVNEWRKVFDRNIVGRIACLLEESRGYVGRAQQSPMYALWIGLNLGLCNECAGEIHDEDLKSIVADWIYGCRVASFKLLCDPSFECHRTSTH
jgi:hypothetical protein